MLTNRVFFIKTDTLKLDSISISAKYFVIKDENNKTIDTSLYKLDYGKALLIVDKSLINKRINVSYSHLGFNFAKIYYHKDYSVIKTALQNNTVVNFNTFAGNKKEDDDFFGAGDLNKSGSISRGVSVGNNQNAVVTSNLNTQLSGKISDKVNILAAISDNNIPIQPDGSSQQLQEFDKIFISVFDENNKLTVGDFQISKPEGYFMNLHKKQQGAMFETDVKLKGESRLKSKISGALARGKYNRQQILPIEGNQGPYRLHGAENEVYIIVLSGSEKVYINGHLLIRGKENDYVIDYNTGEITFTSKNLITKNTRIIVEFEYSDKNYTRFSIFNTNYFQTEKVNLYFNIYSQSDSKNQPVNQDLSTEEKKLLSGIGDSLQKALIYNIDSVGFNQNEILYKKIDSLGYSNVFVYSTNPDSAVYRLGFSLVGKNKGNYIKTTSAANGRVYKWVAPVSGIPQGDYEPVKILVTPKKQQMASAGGEIKISKTFETNFEIAVSNNDLNTFSDKDNANNNGLAVKLISSKHFLTKNTNSFFFTDFKYRCVQKTFTAIERFNTVEFEKDWNIRGLKTMTDEHIFGINTGFNNNKIANISYSFDFLQRPDIVSAYRNGINAFFNKNSYILHFKGSLVNSENKNFNSTYGHYNINMQKQFDRITIGLGSEMEYNMQQNDSGYINLPSSYNYRLINAFIKNNDTNETKFFAKYIFRQDYTPYLNKLIPTEQSNDFNITIELLSNRKNVLRTLLSIRDMQILDTNLSINNAENSLAGRIDYTLRWFKGLLVSNIYYETASGMEEKKAFTYLEVPAGQGVDTWIDRNENNIQELDEFELAAFSDQAKYIRIYTPSNEYIKVFSNSLSQSVNIFPKRIWFNTKGIKAFLARFSNITAYKISAKNTFDNFPDNINPFSNLTDSVLISANNSFRNNLSFNKTAQVWGIDFITNTSRNKNITVNGYEHRKINGNALRLRFNFLQFFSFNYFVNNDLQEYISQYFTTRNYKINKLDNEINLSFQANVKFRLAIIYKNSFKKNLQAFEKSENNNIGLEIRYNEINKGNLQFNFNFIKIWYNADVNTSVAYQMLQGLYPGNNATWSIIYSRNLTNFLQLNLSYNGRTSEGIPIIHTGTIQVRAFF